MAGPALTGPGGHTARPLVTRGHDGSPRSHEGLYQRALAGEIANFTGLSDPYEVPEQPEFVLDTAGEGPEASARRVVDKLVQLGLVAPEVPA
jgi:adenylylsulfate kinase-like enzyme